ncbi:DUF4362 domain-containing protein [Virgibacillus kekensis]|uniref:DUF4362 domain-containing protein n=1 Tax=Virgibacillus kekensis TaxID=202261 RepID=A0ABV9DGD7_9BACI
MKNSFLEKSILFSLSLIMFTLFLSGCNTAEDDSTDDMSTKQEEQMESSGESTVIPPDEPKPEATEEYLPNENDVVLKNNELKNVDLLENFMEVAGKNNESKIRVVKYVRFQGVIIYELQSRYDENANEGWISVEPDLSYYKPSDNEVQDVFNNAGQQCGYITKDTVEGFYKLNECRTHWEYRFLPIPQ